MGAPSRAFVGRVVIGSILFCSLALAAETEERARALDREAREAFQKKEYARAARTFERAFEIEPHPATEYNAGLAWDEAGEPARAADAFSTALALPGLDPERTRASEERLAVLLRRLATLNVTKPVGGSVTVAHVVRAAIPAKIHLKPGAHTLLVRLSSGREVTHDVVVEAAKVTSVQIPDEAPERPTPRAAPAKTSPTRQRPRAEEPGGRSYLAPGLCFGASAVFAGAAVYLGLRAVSARDDYVENHRSSQSAYDDAVRLRTFTNVAWGAAAVSAAVGAGLLVWGGPESAARGRATIGLGPGQARARLEF